MNFSPISHSIFNAYFDCPLQVTSGYLECACSCYPYSYGQCVAGRTTTVLTDEPRIETNMKQTSKGRRLEYWGEQRHRKNQSTFRGNTFISYSSRESTQVEKNSIRNEPHSLCNKRSRAYYTSPHCTYLEIAVYSNPLFLLSHLYSIEYSNVKYCDRLFES